MRVMSGAWAWSYRPASDLAPDAMAYICPRARCSRQLLRAPKHPCRVPSCVSCLLRLSAARGVGGWGGEAHTMWGGDVRAGGGEAGQGWGRATCSRASARAVSYSCVKRSVLVSPSLTCSPPPPCMCAQPPPVAPNAVPTKALMRHDVVQVAGDDGRQGRRGERGRQAQARGRARTTSLKLVLAAWEFMLMWVMWSTLRMSCSELPEILNSCASSCVCPRPLRMLYSILLG